MILLAGLIHLPKKLVLAICMTVILGHNLLDYVSPTGLMASNIWTIIHNLNVIRLGSTIVLVVYQLVPWLFVMPLGYYFGELYSDDFLVSKRILILKRIGLGFIFSFLVLRFLNIYGDPHEWVIQQDFSHTIISFFNVNKYPPSLLYLLITLGPAILLLSFLEKWDGNISKKLIIIGRVPMFFYLIHIFLIHILALFAAKLTGFLFSDMVIDLWITQQKQLKGYGFNLFTVYIIWILVVVVSFPLVRRYNAYKSNNPDKWYLSYM